MSSSAWGPSSSTEHTSAPAPSSALAPLSPNATLIPAGSLVAGVPAKVRRPCTEADLASIRAYANNYLEYTKTYLAEP